MTEEQFAELTDKGQRLLEEYRQALEAEQRWSQRKVDVMHELIAEMGDANKATVGGRHVFTRVTRENFNEHRFQEEQARLYQDFIVPMPQFDRQRFRAALPDVYRDYCKTATAYLRLVRS